MAVVPVVVLAAQAGPTGYLEICKEAGGPTVSGSFSFQVGGQTVVAPVGACSAPVALPPGRATIVETPVEGIFVSDVQAVPADRLVARDLVTGTAEVTIVAGDVSTQTVVTFTNRAQVAPLKVCKVAGNGIAVGTEFDFLAGTESVTVPAGPRPGGYCVAAGWFPAATNVTITEVMPRGIEVSGIAVSPSARLVGEANVRGGSVVVRIGPGFTEATFTNQLAPVAPTTTTTAPPSPTTTTTTVAPVATTTTIPAAATTTTTVPGG